VSRPGADHDSQPWRPMPRLFDTVELVEQVGRMRAGTRGTIRAEGTYVALVDVGEDANPSLPEALVPVPYRAIRRVRAAGEAA
jgi:hypothetical protein